MKKKMHDTQKKRNGWKVKQVDEVAEAGEDLHVAEAGETLHVAEAADISNNDTGVIVITENIRNVRETGVVVIRRVTWWNVRTKDFVSTTKA